MKVDDEIAQLVVEIDALEKKAVEQLSRLKWMFRTEKAEPEWKGEGLSPHQTLLVNLNFEYQNTSESIRAKRKQLEILRTEAQRRDTE